MRGIGSCLSEATQQPVEAYAVVDKAVQVGDVDACLSHGVALAQGDGIVFERLMVDGDAEGCAYGILATVALAYGVFFVVMCGEVEFEVVDDFACFSGSPSLRTRGITAHLTGASGSGRWSTTRVSPFSRACSS